MIEAAAQTPPPAPQGVTYKTVGDLGIRLDIFGGGGNRKPAVMWVHGGALIMGSRKSVPRALLDQLLAQGCVVASIDYRLAPETKLPDIIEDLREAYDWLREHGPERFGLDPDRIAVAGGSAGGYLTLMTGFCVKPKPRALVSYYGYGDITTPWYAEPSAFYLQQPLVTKEAAEASVGKAAVTEPPAGSNRGRFYLYCRQQGIWPREVAGHDPRAEPKWFDDYCPIRNVSTGYPPTLLIHGTADTDVPYDESRSMAARLKAAGIAHELITVTGAGHGLLGAPPEEVKKIDARAVEFLLAHLQARG